MRFFVITTKLAKTSVIINVKFNFIHCFNNYLQWFTENGSNIFANIIVISQFSIRPGRHIFVEVSNKPPIWKHTHQFCRILRFLLSNDLNAPKRKDPFVTIFKYFTTNISFHMLHHHEGHFTNSKTNRLSLIVHSLIWINNFFLDFLGFYIRWDFINCSRVMFINACWIFIQDNLHEYFKSRPYLYLQLLYVNLTDDEKCGTEFWLAIAIQKQNH